MSCATGRPTCSSRPSWPGRTPPTAGASSSGPPTGPTCGRRWSGNRTSRPPRWRGRHTDPSPRRGRCGGTSPRGGVPVVGKPTPRKARPGRRVVVLRVRGRVYHAVLTPDRKAGGYTVRVPGLPGCITEGDTLAEAKRMTKEAIDLWLSVAELEGVRIRATPPSRSPRGRALR
ncbi:MAG: type II toxin-antitoxin system HicB family antitoxin [Anaeromyxobacter sp.]|nr:type II toxin-antitoxin system HicB family antitoxin [Anaeromyxobacter sp.]